MAPIGRLSWLAWCRNGLHSWLRAVGPLPTAGAFALCNGSDTEEGMAIGAVVVARLQASSAFQADLASARQELAQESVKARKPTRDCAVEAMALQSSGLFAG